MTRIGLLGTIMIAAALLAACGSGNTDTATFSEPSTTTPAVDPSLRVPEPLNVGDLTTDPCQGLSDDQATQIGLRTPGVATEDQGAGPSCRYESIVHDANKIFIAPLSTTDAGISGIYAHRETNKYFEPTTIEGYPAAFAGAADVRSRGTCALYVGVTDQLAVGVISSIVTGPNKPNPCPIVNDVAVAMVRHLKDAA